MGLQHVAHTAVRNIQGASQNVVHVYRIIDRFISLYFRTQNTGIYENGRCKRETKNENNKNKNDNDNDDDDDDNNQETIRPRHQAREQKRQPTGNQSSIGH